MAQKDELTGLFNYRYFKNRIKEEIARASRYNGEFSLVMFDIDDFKSYNDEFGHDAGNYVLQKIGELVKKTMRLSDIGIRYGGEEFIIILPNTSKEFAFIFSEKLRTGIMNTKFNRKVTISGGITEFPKDINSSNWQDLLKLADKSLYISKENNKNQFTIYYSERRKFKRHKIINKQNLFIDIKLNDYDFIKATLLDVSLQGIQLSISNTKISSVDIKKLGGEKIRTEFSIENNKIIAEAFVAYLEFKNIKSEKNIYIGLKFIDDIEKLTKKLIKNN